MGFATAEPLTLRFPELTTELRACRRRATQGKYGHRASERVRQSLIEALSEFPPPSCAAVVRSLAGHWTQIREDFPDLWRSLRQRHGEYVREVRGAKREAFADEVYRAVAELHRQGFVRMSRWCSQLSRIRSSTPEYGCQSGASRPSRTLDQALRTFPWPEKLWRRCKLLHQCHLR